MSETELAERVEQLENAVGRLQQDRDRLAEENEQLRDELKNEREQREQLENAVDNLEKRMDATSTRIETSREMVGELQSRELEKGANLDWETVKPQNKAGNIDVSGGSIEKITRDDGTKAARLPDQADPLDGSGSVALSTGDLLPVQRLAQMDDDLLARTAGTKPDRLAAQLWRERDDQSGWVWSKGSKKVSEYADASDVKAWIKTQEDGIKEQNAKKLAGRVLAALRDLTRNRCYVTKRSRKKDGLEYDERRIVVPSDSEIPGESTSSTGADPETTVVAGD